MLARRYRPPRPAGPVGGSTVDLCTVTRTGTGLLPACPPLRVLPMVAYLAHDLARVQAGRCGRPITLADLAAADEIAAALITRWQPRPATGGPVG